MGRSVYQFSGTSVDGPATRPADRGPDYGSMGSFIIHNKRLGREVANFRKKLVPT